MLSQPQTEYDVLICGGGLAGLTLARQLRLELPELTVAVVERQARPIPEAAHKVGESCIEMASTYFGQVLQLADYLDEQHLHKFGLRFFLGDAREPLDKRPEWGIRAFPPVTSYQLDRGRLENDLRGFLEQMDAHLFEGAIVDDVEFGSDGVPHRVDCRWSSGGRFSLRGRWLIDALGRRKFLQARLGLKRPVEHFASAAWWRLAEVIDVSELGSPESHRWRARTMHTRYLSTNHLMGYGYWVWLIPLGSGATSVGIVTDESIHPFKSYGRSYECALEWLHQHEPVLAGRLADRKPLDFHGLKNYAYSSQQAFSVDRWCCVGEAALFLDPLYSLGSEFISAENQMTVELIRRDMHGQLSQEIVARFNHLLLDILCPFVMDFYRGSYVTFGHAHVFFAKQAWDTAMQWAFMMPPFLQRSFDEPVAEFAGLAERYRALNQRVQALFIDWAEATEPRSPHVELTDVTKSRLHQILHLELLTRRTPAQVVQALELNLQRFEELAIVLFRQAVSECLPDLHATELGNRWVNAWAISLDPGRWAEDGLFRPLSAARSLTPMRDSVAGIFTPLTLRQWLLQELPYRLLLFGRAVVYRTVIRFLIRILFHNRAALLVRGLFVPD